MNNADIPFLSATTLGELIRKQEISPVEAAAAYLDRIDAVDGKLHSYITVCRDEANGAGRCMVYPMRSKINFGLRGFAPLAVRACSPTSSLAKTPPWSPDCTPPGPSCWAS